ncbi:LysE family translocator [uncultured Methylibium sp.]|uniref:LysE family translocator n=1 Tax=uncultured Methylibium sp. TaxID=381093 RepID=UPI0025E4F133|nr:LysE family translocator [uncultured Methylibium sp.]
MDPSWLFALLVLGIIVMPGMDMAYVLSSTLVDGRRAGAAAVAGLVVGGMVHVAMSSLGIGLLLQLLPAAFNALLVAGALYVAWMGWSLLRHPGSLGEVGDVPSRPTAQTFLRAILTCLLNPKAYVFMIAVFPQFMRPDQGGLLRQVLGLGAIVAVTQAVVYGSVVAGAAGLRRCLRGSAARQVRVARSVGGLLIATAAWTLWQSWRAV